MNQPKWAKEYQAQKEKEQITIMRRPNMSGLVQKPYQTGLGADGRLQPRNPTGVTMLENHEGEGVMPAWLNMSPVGKEVRQYIKTRTGWDMEAQKPRVQGNTVKMDTGGMTPWEIANQPAEQLAATAPVAGTPVDVGPDMTNPTTAAQVGASILNPPVSAIPAVNTTVDKPVAQQVTRAAAAPTIPTLAPPVVDRTATPTAQTVPAATPSTVTPIVNTNLGVQAPAPAAQTITAPGAVPATVTAQPSTSYADTKAKQALQNISQMAAGESEIFENIRNAAFGQLAPYMQTQLTQAAMKIAANPNMTEGARRAAMAGAMRDVGIAESNLSAQMADKALNMALTATQAQYGMASGQQAYEYGKQRDALEAAINAKDYTTASELSKQLYGRAVDYSSMKSSEDSTNYNRAFADIDTEIATQGITTADAAFAIPKIKESLQTAWDTMTDTAKAGVDFETWSKNTLGNLMYAKSPLGRIVNGLGGKEYLIEKLPGVSGDPEKWAQFEEDMMGLYTSGGVKFNEESGELDWTPENAMWERIGKYFDPSAFDEGDTNRLVTSWDPTKGTVQYDADKGNYYSVEDGELVTKDLDAYLTANNPGAKTGDVAKDAGGKEYRLQESGTWEAKGADADVYESPADVGYKALFGTPELPLVPTAEQLWGTGADNVISGGTPEQKKAIEDARVEHLTKHPEELKLRGLKTTDAAYTKVAEKLPNFSSQQNPGDGYYNYNGRIIKTTSAGGNNINIYFTDPLTGNKSVTIKDGAILPNGYQIENTKTVNGVTVVEGEQHPGGIGHDAWTAPLSTVIEWVISAIK